MDMGFEGIIDKVLKGFEFIQQVRARVMESKHIGIIEALSKEEVLFAQNVGSWYFEQQQHGYLG